MDTVSTFLQNFDVEALLYYLVRAGAALLCIVIHELCHGLAAYLLGDETAKRKGRLSLNPLHHIDPFGLILMITAGFGWAKPVPVDMRYFKNPKRGMAITALAGPVSNFVLALAMLGGASVMYHFVTVSSEVQFEVFSWVFTFLLSTAILSVGLGVFNLVPIPPLDGSKVLFSLLPDETYRKILHYERYVMLLLFGLVFAGVLDTPLYMVRTAILAVLCRIVGLPEGVIG